MAFSEADPDATGASLTALIEVSSSTVEEEKTDGAAVWIGINFGSSGGMF